MIGTYLLKADSEALARWKAEASKRGISFAEFVRMALDAQVAGRPIARKMREAPLNVDAQPRDTQARKIKTPGEAGARTPPAVSGAADRFPRVPSPGDKEFRGPDLKPSQKGKR